jgi:divinyl protochlorophyllide a 8-vinyl-reductase
MQSPTMAGLAQPAGRIGPNAITRLAEATVQRFGPAAAARLFHAAGLSHWLSSRPETMVAEDEVRALHVALRAQYDPGTAADLARDAGRRTAHYLLANRIPKPLQWLLRRLPAALAARVLLAAIRRNAWTFVGSGRFQADAGGLRGPAVLTVKDNPLCRGLSLPAPACDFYAATFGTLFAALVHPRSEVREVACEACGESACVFEISW